MAALLPTLETLLRRAGGLGQEKILGKRKIDYQYVKSPNSRHTTDSYIEKHHFPGAPWAFFLSLYVQI